MISKKDTDIFTEHCRAVLDLKNAVDECEGLYKNLPLCILDAVYSMGVRYGSVRKVTARYAAHYGKDAEGEGHTVSDFLHNIDAAGGTDAFARDVLCNRHRTAPRGGILKSESARLVAQVLARRGIETLSDFRTYGDKVELDRAICKTRSQSSGIMLKYLYMLAGDKNMIKPDRMITRFIGAVLPEVTEHSDMILLLQSAAAGLAHIKPDMSPRMLDFCIWRYQRALKTRG